MTRALHHRAAISMFPGEIVESYYPGRIEARGRGVKITAGAEGVRLTVNAASKHGQRHFRESSYGAALEHALAWQRRRGIVPRARAS